MQHSDGRVTTTVSERPLARSGRFVVLTFALSLAVYLPIIASDRGWIPVAVPPALAALGVLGPAGAAFLLEARERGRAGVRHLIRDATARQFGTRWWVATLALPPVLLGTMYAGYRLLGGAHHTTTTLDTFVEAGSGALVAVPVFVLVTVGLAYGEEAGWRGYLLPRLQTRWSALGSSLLLGVVWFLWHVPLLFLPGDQNSAMPLPFLAAFVLASAVLYTWLYNNTGGSVLAATLLHGGFNVWGQFIAVHPSETNDPVSGAVMAGVVALLAVVLVGVYGARTLRRSGDSAALSG
jgi:hypothetical protein